ncbi:NADase-type glycan-binding domain-containing protein [Bergeyella sp. RCAD1439]|uniref:NADase-type glycan-binding domain-containing protein n=1 Tax=Bergeyella anatis TaxID=3113737 RepID=UPI002E17E8F0|nr:Hint domain-containing protein [Bergeyella sp. RCAD1439]
MKRTIIINLISLIVVICVSACGQTQQQTEQTKRTSNEETVSTQELKIIEPTIGSTPDISDDARKKQQRLNELYAKVDSLINTYPDYETAKQHLTERQIEIWENEEEYSKEDHLDVSIWGCNWYCGGGPDRIFASSTLSSNKNLDYKADNVHDFSLRTAWIEGVEGYGIGESITFRFAKQSPPVTTVEIYNGYMKSDKVWQDNSRVKQLKLYVNDKPYALLNLKDIKSKQIFTIDTLQGTDKDLFLKFEITEVYKGDKYDDVAISEIEFDGTGVHCFTKGTLITTPNGQIEIEKLNVGDKVLSFNQQTKKIEVSTILELANQKHHNLYELNFSGTKIIVTDDHPFFFNGQFYSIKENNKYGLQTQELKKGQSINFLVGTDFKTKELTMIKKLNLCEMTYTITKLDKNKIFFANGAYVTTEEQTVSNARNK